MGEQFGIDRVQGGLVEIGRDDAFLEIVEDHVLGTAAKRAESFLVQQRPGLLISLPDHFTEALAGVLERHDEQQRAAELARSIERQRALAVIDLGLFAGRELENIEACGGACPESGDEALDGVVAVREAVRIDQVLVEALGVTTEVELGFNPGAMGLAG